MCGPGSSAGGEAKGAKGAASSPKKGAGAAGAAGKGLQSSNFQLNLSRF